MLYKCVVFAGQEDFPSNIVHFTNVQCWASVADVGLTLRANVKDVGPTSYKFYTNVLCLLGRRTSPQTLYISPMFNVGPASQTLA